MNEFMNKKISNNSQKSDRYDLNEDSLNAYLNEIFNYPLLSLEEEKDLIKRIKDGDTFAKKQLIESNLRLVVSISRKYLNRGVSYLDLIQEGNIGLINSIDKYDLTKGYKFSTYATYWIRRSIIQAVGEFGRTIRIPIHKYEEFIWYIKTKEKAAQKLCREPKIEEIADIMGIDVLTVKKYQQLENDTISLQTIINGESELQQLIPNKDVSVEEQVIIKCLKEEIKKLLMNCDLTEKEKNILIHRYGIDDCKQMKTDELMKLYSVTRQRINQMELKAIEKIRNSKKTSGLSMYLDDPKKALDNLDEFRELYKKQNEKNKEREKRKYELKKANCKLKEIKKYLYDCIEFQTSSENSEDYDKINELLNAPIILELTNKFTSKEIAISVLNCYGANDKNITPSQISSFFQIEEDQVLSITKKVLVDCKSIVDDLSNNSVQKEQEKGLVKVLKN